MAVWRRQKAGEGALIGWAVVALAVHAAVLAGLAHLPASRPRGGEPLHVFEMVALPPAAPARPPSPSPAAPPLETMAPPVLVEAVRSARPAPVLPAPTAKPRPPRPATLPPPIPQEAAPRAVPTASPASAAASEVVPSAPAAAPAADEFVPADASPAYLRNPPPAYPLAARRRGVEGVVTVSAAVDAAGHPTAVTVIRGSGHAMLDRAAEQAVAAWRFMPARRAGIAVASTVEVPVRFTLDN